DEREAEAGSPWPPLTKLLPDALGALPRRARGGRERHPVQVQDERPAADAGRERRRDALDALPVHRRAGEHLFGLHRSLEHLVLLGEEPREHRLGDRDERDRVRDLEHREPQPLRGPRTRPCPNPSPNPSPASPASESRVTYARWRAAVSPAPAPVVSRSSPPLSHGVGS